MFKKALPLSIAVSISLFGADNLFEITPQIGADIRIDNKFERNVDLDYGIRFANRVLPDVLVEAGFDYINGNKYKNTTKIKNQSTNASRYYIDVVKEFATEQTISPYLLGGFGYEHLSNPKRGADSDMFGQYGIGLRWAVADYLHLKTEIRHLINFDGRHDVAATLGFSIPFGTYKQELAQQEPAPAPAKPTLSYIHTFNVQFPFDSAVVAPQYEDDISDFANYLRQHPNQTATINGHTDSTGNAQYNQQLSERRANAVKEKIIEQGIAEDRLNAKGYGQTKPIATNKTKEGRQQNRRVEAEVYQVQ